MITKITTADARFEALPDGAVVVTEDGGIAWQKGDSEPDNPALWWTAGLKSAYVPPLPATLVWQPAQNSNLCWLPT